MCELIYVFVYGVIKEIILVQNNFPLVLTQKWKEKSLLWIDV